MNTFGKAGGEAASGLKKFFIQMIDIAGEVLASALPWLVGKLANIIQGIADFIANPKPAMDAVGKAGEGIGGAFSNAFSKIGKALKPVLPKLGAALKSLFVQLFKLAQPILTKLFIAVIMLSAVKGIAVGLIKAAGTTMILKAIGFLATKMGITFAAASKVQMAKAATTAATGNAGFFASIGASVQAIAMIPPMSIINAGFILILIAGMFSVGMLMFAKAVQIAAKMLAKVPFKDLIKALVVMTFSLVATKALITVAQTINPAAVAKALPSLLAAAVVYTIGIVAFAVGARLAYEILKPVDFVSFAGIVGIVGLALIATGAFVVAGLAFSAIANPPALIAISLGLIAAAALFTVGMVAFGLGIIVALKVLSKVAAQEKQISGAVGAIIGVIKSIALMAGLSAVFAAIGIFVFPLIAGFTIASGFFLALMPLVKKMVGALNKIPITDPKKTGQKIEIIAKLGAAMQAIAKVGLDAGKMALAAEKMKPGGMEIMFKNITNLITKVSDTLITLIAMIVVLGANLTPGQSKNVEILSGAIASIAKLAAAIMSPLEAVSKMSSGMFGPSVSEVMGSVADGLVNIMSKIETALPSLIKQIVQIAKDIKEDPKTLKPKMDIVSGALTAVSGFASAIEAVAGLMPEKGGGFFSKGKDMDQRLAEMTKIISGVVKAVKADIETLVLEIIGITIPNPGEALKRVEVIEKAMGAVSKFAGTVDKLAKMNISGDGMAATVSQIVSGITQSLVSPAGNYDIQTLFTTLGEFSPDESMIPKLETAVSTLNAMASFTGAMVKLKEAGGENYAELGTAVTAIVENAKMAITALNSIGTLDATVALDTFASAIGVGSDGFTISNEPINIHMNVKVEMNAGRISRVLTDKTLMTTAGGPTLATAE